jgi:hypothetical protein
MFKKIIFVASVASVILLTACTVTRPVTATSNPIGTKVGTAKGSSWLWGTLCFKVDNSIKTAAKNGGVTRIATVDRKRKIYPLGFVIQYTTIVTGD